MVVDLAGVGSVDAAGVNALADVAALAEDYDIASALAGVRVERVQKVLAFAQLTDLISTADSLGLLESRRRTAARRRRRPPGWPSPWMP